MTGPFALLVATLLLLTASGAVTALLRPQGRLDTVVTGGVVATVLASTAVLGAGAVGALHAWTLVLVHAGQAGVALALLRRRRPGRPPLGLPRLAQMRAAPWEVGLVLLAAATLGWQLLVALVLPPYAFDALTYHLTTVASWVRSGSLAPTDLSLCCAYYPLNAELLTAWPVALLGSDALVGTVQVLAAVLCGAAVAAIARTVGLRRRTAAAAGALFVLTPALLAQAPTPYVDVVVTALVLSGLHGLTRFGATPGLSRLVVPAACAGLLVGTKGIGPLWGGALLATAVVLGLRHVRGGRLSRRRAVAGLAGFTSACLLLGAWWYVRSAVDTGNPLHPFEVQLAGRVVFEGPLQLSDVLTPPQRGAERPAPVAVGASWAADLLPWRQGSYDYQQRAGGLGPVWVWLGLPLLVPLGVRLWRQRSVALAAAVPVLAVLAVQPYRWWARFTLPLAAMGAVAVATVVEGAPRPALRRALQATTALLAAAGCGLVLVEVDPASRAEPLPASRVLSLVAAPAEERALGRVFLPEYRFLEDVPARATIVVDLEAPAVRFVYPLFGPRLQRAVVPAGSEPVPVRAWVVTADGRPLAAEMRRRRGAPFFADRDLLVWAPAS